MSIRFEIAERVARQVGLTWGRQKARARLRRELADTSDRALAELRLARGDIEDVVAGTYRRAA